MNRSSTRKGTMAVFFLSAALLTNRELLQAQNSWSCSGRSERGAFAQYYLPQTGGMHTLQIDVPSDKTWAVGNPANIQWIKVNIDPRSANKATIIVTAEPNMTNSCRLASLSVSGVNPWYPLRLDIWQDGLPSAEPASTVVNLPPRAPVQQTQASAVQAAAIGTPVPTAMPTVQTAAIQAPAAQKPLRLEDGTPVKLRINQTISSADAQVNDRVDFEVLEEVKVGDLLVIPKGGLAWATVTEAQPKRRMGRGGKLNINIDAVRLLTGEKAALRAVKETKGGGHVGAMTAGIVATSLVFFPAAPLFLLVHGKDITIPKGTEVTAFINGDLEIDRNKFLAAAGLPPATAPVTAPSQQVVAAPQQVPAQALSPPNTQELSTVTIKSSPDGADILLDGKFVGTTPSSLRIAPGDHTISLERSGFETWQRTISVSPGSSITVDHGLNKKN